MILNEKKDGIMLCPMCNGKEFIERDKVSLAERPSDKTIHVVKRYREYICSDCGYVLKKIQAPA